MTPPRLPTDASGVHPTTSSQPSFTRRAALIGATACVVTAAATTLALRVDLFLEDPVERIKRIGRAYLDDHPEVTSRAELASQLGLAGSVSAAEGALRLLEDDERIRSDFAQRRTVVVDGWVLSETEVRAAAMLTFPT